MIFKIKEKFITISGEAPVPGKPVYLIRFSGCNLSCRYCDTPQVDQVSYRLSTEKLYEDIMKTCEQYPYLSILFTGGEPLLGDRQEILFSLIDSLKNKAGIYIETNGSMKIRHFPDNTHFVCDWKAPSSGYGNSFDLENLNNLRPGNDCIKFVISKEDFQWVIEKISHVLKTNPQLPLYLSPQWGTCSFMDMAELILKNKLPVTLSLQLHKIIWGNEKEGIRN